MRTQLSGLALLGAALALPCAADVARAQGSPGYGYAPGSQTVPASYWTAGYGQGYQGYGYPQNYADYYRYYQQYYQYYQQYYARFGYPYPQNSFTNTAPTPADVGLPSAAVGPDGEPAHSGDEVKKAGAPAHRDCFWVSADYVAAWIKPWRMTTPLATTGLPPFAGAPAGYHPAGIGQPSTANLIGDKADFDNFNGVKLGVGVYLDDAGRVSLEWLGQYNIPNDVRPSAVSDASGNPIVGRPILDVNTGAERAFLDSNPGFFAGGVTTNMHSEFFSTELNLHCGFCPADCCKIDTLLGFRFTRLTESLTMHDTVTPLVDGSGLTFEAIPLPAGVPLTDVDSFKTTNHFYGANIGGGIKYAGKWLEAGVFGKVGLGVTDQQADIFGATAVHSAVAGTQVAAGGIYAQGTNMGQHNRTVFGFLPEAGVNVGFNVCPSVRLTAGYSFLWWNSVLRPGAQIDRVINPTQVPSDNTFGTVTGPPRPLFKFNDENFWMHSVTAGVEFHY